MMKPEQLRIRNWITIEGIAYTINAAMLAEIEKSNCTYRKLIKPIQLNNEVLSKCGFVFNDGLWYNCEYENIKIEYAGSHCQLISKGYLGNPFQYLHELQNIIYALFRTELSITL